MNRVECLDYMYADIIRQQYVTRAAFDEAVKNWEVEPMLIGEKSIGVIATQGHEIHVTLDKRGALLHAKRIIKACLVDRIAKHGYMVTRAMSGDAGVARFLERLGFKRTGEDDACTYYRIEQTKIH
jgi:hypothetical protein